MSLQVGDTVYLCYPDHVVQSTVISVRHGWLRVHNSNFAFRMPTMECGATSEAKPSLHRCRADAEAAMLTRMHQGALRGYMSILEADKDLLNFMREIQGRV